MASRPRAGRGDASLIRRDAQQASEAFFTGLGFEIEDRWEQDGKLLGLMLKAGEARLGLSQDDGKKGMDRGDIDAIAARAKAAGVTPQSEPKDTAWATRAFDVTEPSGFLITIASPAATK